MGPILEAAWRVFGPVVLTWSVRQLLEWWEGQGGAPGDVRAELTGCAPLCPQFPDDLGREDEAFFWDEPESVRE